MGTNYYWHKNTCPCCKRSEEVVHIGKSSGGWPFNIHIYPEKDILSWKDWMGTFECESGIIKDEYGGTITPQKLNELVEYKRMHKDEEYVLKANRDYPHIRRSSREGDTLSTGEFS